MDSLVIAGRRFTLLPINMRIVRLVDESGYVGKPVVELTDAKAHAFMLDVIFASISRVARQRWWEFWKPAVTREWLDEAMPAEEMAEAFARVCGASRRKVKAPEGEAGSP